MSTFSNSKLMSMSISSLFKANNFSQILTKRKKFNTNKFNFKMKLKRELIDLTENKEISVMLDSKLELLNKNRNFLGNELEKNRKRFCTKQEKSLEKIEEFKQYIYDISDQIGQKEELLKKAKKDVIRKNNRVSQLENEIKMNENNSYNYCRNFDKDQAQMNFLEKTFQIENEKLEQLQNKIKLILEDINEVESQIKIEKNSIEEI